MELKDRIIVQSFTEANEDQLKGWHPNVIIKDKKGNKLFVITNCRSGCGALNLSGWYANADMVFLEEALKKLLDDVKNITRGTVFSKSIYDKYDVGMIYTTLGQNFYDGPFEKLFIKLGFKIVSEYPNPRHGGNYKQKLLVWTK